jgi:carbonic anhydrase
MVGLQSSSLLDAAKEKKISQEQIDILTNSGIDLSKWLTGFQCVEESVRNSVHLIKNHPLLPDSIAVHGMVIHPETGKLDRIIDGYSNIVSKDEMHIQ